MKDCLHKALTCIGGQGNEKPGHEWECLSCGQRLSYKEVSELPDLGDIDTQFTVQRELFYDDEECHIRGAMGTL